MSRNEEIARLWAVYSDVLAEGAARRDAAVALARLTGDTLCPHYLLGSLGPCEQCQAPIEELKRENARLQAENEDLRLRLEAALAELRQSKGGRAR